MVVVDAGPRERAASHGNAGWVVPSLAAPVPGPGLLGQSLRWMSRSDSPLYIRPRADPAFWRWILAFWRHCNERDFRAGFEAVAAFAAPTMTLFDRLRAEGVVFEERRDGLVFVYRSPTELVTDHRRLELLRPFGYQVPPLLDGDGVRSLEPVLGEGVVGGYRIPGERHLLPETLVDGLVHRLGEAGVVLRHETAVVGFDEDHGRIAAVSVVDRGTGEGRTPAFERIAAEAVVVCAGAWTPDVLRLVGSWLPIAAGKGYSLDYRPPPNLADPVRHPLYLHEARIAVSPFDGMVRLAGTMELSGQINGVDPRRVAAIPRSTAGYLRNWPTDPARATTWAGARPMTPDGLPAIGHLPGFANLLVATGHAMLGVTLALATGEAVAEILVSGHPPAGALPFDPGRFGRRHRADGNEHQTILSPSRVRRS